MRKVLLGVVSLGLLLSSAAGEVPHVVGAHSMNMGGVTNNNSFNVTRFWSDGAVDCVGAIADLESCTLEICNRVWLIPPNCSADIDKDGTVGVNDVLAMLAEWSASCIQPASTVDVAFRHTSVGHSEGFIRVWSDGYADLTSSTWMNEPQGCPIVTLNSDCPQIPLLEGSCTKTDVDRDGEVGVTDLLEVLAAWGPCL